MTYELFGPGEATITIQRVEFSGAPPSDAWVIEYLPLEGGGAAPHEAIAQLLSESRSDEGWYPEYYIERRQSVYEWGASASGETILLGITAALAYDLLRASVLALVKRIREADRATFQMQPLTSDEAVERARWRIESVFPSRVMNSNFGRSPNRTVTGSSSSGWVIPNIGQGLRWIPAIHPSSN